MKAIIMAGGEGSRLRPLTCDRPKPMVPILDRPIMQHIVELLASHGLRDIGSTLMYLPEDIKDFFGSGADFGVNMQYFVEESPLGTAGSVRNAQEFLDQPFLVISGDALTDFDLTKIIKFHREKQSAVTIALTRVPTPLEYGVVITDEAGHIKQFLEKPSWGQVFSDTVNTGIYVIEPEILGLVPEGTSFDFSKDLFPLLLKKGYPIFGCIMSGYWCDIGNFAQYQQAHFDILTGRTKISWPEQEITKGVWVGAGAEIHPEACLEGPVFIGQNVKVGKKAYIGSCSVVGAHSIIEEEATIKRGIIWNNVYFGKRAALRGGAICNRVKVKSHAAIYENAVVGDDTILDNYVTIKPGVKIWPHKKIEKGAILQGSLIWADTIRKNLFGANGISGTVNIEITPEAAVRLGAAFGSLSKMQGQIAISANGYPSAQMIKKALATGLLASGCHVLDFGQVATPVSRYGVRTLGLYGGIHVDALDQGEKVCLIFFDDQGANINIGLERKLENIFSREDFCRVSGTTVTWLKEFPELITSYYKDLYASINIKVLKDTRLKVFLVHEPIIFGQHLPQFLENLGCDLYISERLAPTGADSPDFTWYQEQVVSNDCDLGVMMHSNGESLTLIDNLGRIIKEDLYTALVTLMVLRSHSPATIAVPVTAPQIIESVAKKYQGKVVRTKTSKQFYMEQILGESILSTQKGCQQFAMEFDAIYALTNILNYLAQEKSSLADLVGTVPDFYLVQRDIECPWQAKGQVMRKLIEEKAKKSELLDGIKVFHDQGWALVLPDADEPVCRIFSEGVNMEAAEELTAMYADKVNNYKKM